MLLVDRFRTGFLVGDGGPGHWTCSCPDARVILISRGSVEYGTCRLALIEKGELVAWDSAFTEEARSKLRMRLKFMVRRKNGKLLYV